MPTGRAGSQVVGDIGVGVPTWCRGALSVFSFHTQRRVKQDKHPTERGGTIASGSSCVPQSPPPPGHPQPPRATVATVVPRGTSATAGVAGTGAGPSRQLPVFLPLCHSCPGPSQPLLFATRPRKVSAPPARPPTSSHQRPGAGRPRPPTASLTASPSGAASSRPGRGTTRRAAAGEQAEGKRLRKGGRGAGATAGPCRRHLDLPRSKVSLTRSGNAVSRK